MFGPRDHRDITTGDLRTPQVLVASVIRVLRQCSAIGCKSISHTKYTLLVNALNAFVAEPINLESANCRHTHGWPTSTYFKSNDFPLYHCSGIPARLGP